MFKGTILYIPRSEAIRYAGEYLSEMGLQITRKAAPDISHVLLPVPSFSSGDEYLAHVLTDLSDDVIISGGNLNSPLLEGYAAVDFLQDPYYLAENAAITADCTLRIVKNKLPSPLAGSSVLVVGWGRIGKCLGQLLKCIGSDVTIAARKETDRAMIEALDMQALDIKKAGKSLGNYRLIINTVPEMILSREDMASCHPDCVKIELASKPGMDDDDVIVARGLPGVHMPESSGNLIAKTFLRLYQKEG